MTIEHPGDWQTHSEYELPISIVTVVRRSPEELESTLSSLIAAGFGECELIVIEGDDRDSEPSRRLRERFAPQFRHFHWLLAPDRGIYDAMNRGTAAARGEWIWFVNAGDMADTELGYASLAASLDGYQEDWVVASARVVGDPRRSPEIKPAAQFSVEDLWAGRYVPCHQAVFVRRLALAGASGFDLNYRISADYALFLKLSRRGRPGILERIVVDYRRGGVSQVDWRRRNLEAARARRRLLSPLPKRRQALNGVRLARRLLTPSWVHERRRLSASRRSPETVTTHSDVRDE
jgi:glycosyltransferase involved in cell wall biosynthesis